jgi:ferrous iron transport protein A
MTFNFDKIPRTMVAIALEEAGTDRRVCIERIDLEGEAGAWLAAVGLHEGEELVVLRRAAFGGPLHVRTSSGGEFAVAREVASQIRVRDVGTRAETVGAP